MALEANYLSRLPKPRWVWWKFIYLYPLWDAYWERTWWNYDSAGPDGFDDLIVQEKDGTVVARRLRTKVLLTLGRLVNIVITGLGSRLEIWLQSLDTNSTPESPSSSTTPGHQHYSDGHKHLNLMWATWMELRRCPDECIVLNALTL